MALTKKQIGEIRALLSESKNPLFFFDDDPDGLCAFLLLHAFRGEGSYVCVKSTPEVNGSFAHVIGEKNPDLVVVLDKPMLSDDFLEQCNVTTIWIDHHEPQHKHKDFPLLKYYNPRVKDDKDNRSTTYWAYQIAQRDLWKAMAGCIGDWQLPDFTKEFVKQYPALLDRKVKTPEEALFNSPIGKISRMFSFLLKMDTPTMKRCISALMKVKDPSELLEQSTPEGKFVYVVYARIYEEYKALLRDVLEQNNDEKLILYIYHENKRSFTADLSNELLYRFPEKMIIIAREKDGEMKCSLRSAKHILPPLLEKALIGVKGYGGGHEHACGCAVKIGDWDVFLAALKKSL